MASLVSPALPKEALNNTGETQSAFNVCRYQVIHDIEKLDARYEHVDSG